MRVQFSVFAAVAALSAMPASAEEYVGEFGGWYVARADEACGMTMDFEGPGETTFTLLKFPDGTVTTSISNMAWSAKKDDRYEVSYLVNGTAYSGSGLGINDYVKSGFMSKFDPEFAEDFAKGSSLHVYLGEQQIDQLSLDGSAAALAAVDRCLRKVRADLAAAAREKARYAHLPEDPFAGAPVQAPSVDGPRGASPLNQSSIGRRVMENYPSAALRESRQGTVGLSVSIGADGRVLGCSVTASSGHADLDDAACQGMARYARFSPALDAAGEPTEGSWSTVVTYGLN
jgi:protein TonB